MKKSELSQSGAVAAVKRKSGGSITSLDRKRTITLEEFDRLFDEGSDEVDAFLDWSKPVFRHGGHRPNSGRKPSGRKPFQIRLRPEIHAQLKRRARKRGISISELVEKLVQKPL